MNRHEVLLDIYVTQRTDPKIVMVLWLFCSIIEESAGSFQ